MISDSFAQALRDKLRKLLNDYADHAAAGVVADWPSYQYLRGKIEGVAIAERELLDLAERYDNDDK